MDFNEIDILLDLEAEEQQVRVATREEAANRNLEDAEADNDYYDYYHTDYWSQQSGWNGDDEEMEDQASTYYSYEGDTSQPSGDYKTAVLICGALVGIIILVVLVRYSTHWSSARINKEGRRTSSSARNKKRRQRSTSRDRSRSRSRGGSQSSRRTKESDVESSADEDYQLVEDNASSPKVKKGKGASSVARKKKHRSRSKKKTSSRTSRRAE